jgi:hypothetical protein
MIPKQADRKFTQEVLPAADVSGPETGQRVVRVPRWLCDKCQGDHH